VNISAFCNVSKYRQLKKLKAVKLKNSKLVDKTTIGVYPCPSVVKMKNSKLATKLTPLSDLISCQQQA